MAVLWPLAAQAEPLVEHTDVFISQEEGYYTYRIPSVTTAPDGTLIAIVEGRKDKANDPGDGDIDLVYKRSTDNGKTWSKLQILDDPGDNWGVSNPTAVVDRERGRILVVFARWQPGYGTREAEPGEMHSQVWLRTSDDNGKTWSEARDITSQARDIEHVGAVFFGPGSGIQTRTGRLLIPAAGKAGGGPKVEDLMHAYALYSDDGGETWKRGRMLGGAPTNENQFVELKDGRILINARQGQGDHQIKAVSYDQGETWDAPEPAQACTPVATAVQRFHPPEMAKGRSVILWSGPKGPGRNNLTIRISYNNGDSWVEGRQLTDEFSSYSDLTVLGDGTVGVLWERRDQPDIPGGTVPKFTTFTRFNWAYLQQGQD